RTLAGPPRLDAANHRSVPRGTPVHLQHRRDAALRQDGERDDPHGGADARGRRQRFLAGRRQAARVQRGPTGAWDEDTARIDQLWPQIPAGRLQEEDVAFGQWPGKTYWIL